MRRQILFLLLAFSMPAFLCGATTRNYYVAAENVMWNYAPSGQDFIHGGPVPLPWARYLTWPKIRYIEYTDDTFSTKKSQPEWLGILGPIIRAEVGDTIVVKFCNKAGEGAFGMHPHGLRYTKDNEGAHYMAGGAGGQVEPGECFTYTWFADAGSGPGPGDPSSLVWWYHSHVDEPAETNAGLLGPIVVTKAGMADALGRPTDIDREFIAMFFIFNEDGGRERGMMHAINGYIFGNANKFIAQNGERVRWYLLGMGNEVDLHTAHWHGKTVRYSGRNTDVIELLPGSMATVDMTADNPGTWLFHCHVADHIDAGMITTWTIEP